MALDPMRNKSEVCRDTPHVLIVPAPGTLDLSSTLLIATLMPKPHASLLSTFHRMP